jgi:hypothetical protein
MTIKKFITYECDTCKRAKDLPVDLIHGFVDKCTITKNCTGRLFPIKAKNLRDILPTKGAAGLQNWSPRGTNSPSVSSVNQLIEYDISSNVNRAMTLISKEPFATAPSTYSLSFTVQLDSVQDYIEYDYTLASGSKIVIGKDTSGKTLRFLPTDLINVYVQGVLRPQADATLGYTLNYQSDVGYSVEFNTAQSFATSVKIVVFQGVTLTETTPLYFTKNSILSIDSAWANVEAVNLAGEQWTVYTCTSTTGLPDNSQLNLYEVALDPIKSRLEDFYFLLSYSPYSIADRVYSIGVQLNRLSLPGQYIKVTFANNIKTLKISSDSLAELKNLQLLKLKTASAEILSTADTSSAQVIDFATSIIGPV